MKDRSLLPQPPPLKGRGGFRKHAILVLAGAVSLFIGIQFIRLLQPAQAREIRAACKGLRASPQNSAYGSIPSDTGRYPEAIPFRAQNKDGEVVELSDYRGKVVLVNFWASWCDVCKSEKPSLEALQARYDRDDLEVVTLASNHSWDKVKEALPNGTPLTVLLDPPDDDGLIGAVAKAYGVKAVPETFAIDKRGKLRHYFINKRDWRSDVAETCISALLHE